MPKQAAYYERDRASFLDWVGGNHERILDVGCGAGSNAAWYRRHGGRELIGIEVDPQSADRASTPFDRVVSLPVELAMAELDGAFDLIVCADVLEHLVDPWAVVTELRRLSHPTTVLAVSMPNIRFLPAIAQIAIGSGFRYEDEGIFDVTHLRFFTPHDLDRLLRHGGWEPERRGAQMYGRLRWLRRMAGRLTGAWTDQWLAEQQFIAARPGRSDQDASRDRPASSAST
jgi:2-polyprenyl-3-methyl-5-hydroxy-6-metoxy-1,4-benzoquinol methylase